MNKLNKTNLALIIVGFYVGFIGVTYMPYFNYPPDAYGIEMITSVVSVWIWVALWLAVGAFAIASGIIGKTSFAAWGMVIGLKAMWGVAYSYGIINSVASGTDVEMNDVAMTVRYLSFAVILFLLNKGRYENVVTVHNDCPDCPRSPSDRR